MKTRLSAAIAVVVLAAGGAAADTIQDKTMEPDAETPAQMLAYVEEQLAGYHYQNAAYWAYRLQQQGTAPPPHLQKVLAEQNYDPEAPVSSGSMFWLSPQQLALLKQKAAGGDVRAAKRVWEFYTFSAPDSQRQQADYWAGKAGIGAP